MSTPSWLTRTGAALWPPLGSLPRWGKAFDSRFDERVTVVNSAAGGRSVRTWLYEVQTELDDTGECALACDASGAPRLQARGGDVSAETTGPVGDFFCDDHTHFDTPGAAEIGELVVDALLAQGISLAAYLR